MTSEGQLRLDFTATPATIIPPEQSPSGNGARGPGDNAQQKAEWREFALNGLDGGNPLGFLAAVGVLQSVSAMEPAGDWRMWWQQDAGPWHPTLAGNTALRPAQLPHRLADYLRDTDNEALAIGKNLTISPDLSRVSPDLFREFAKDAQDIADRFNRRRADFIASFGCENATGKGMVIQNTALRVAGGGRQHFLDTMRQTVKQTDSEHLRRSLFESWKREDLKLGLRWDPDEDRRYALRWKDPSSEDAKTERGANRLAIEALPLLPTAISRAGLETTGFRQGRGRVVYFSWPLWTCRVNIATVASILRLDELRRNAPRLERLIPLGIAAVYRSRRVTEPGAKYRNFMPATPV